MKAFFTALLTILSLALPFSAARSAESEFDYNQWQIRTNNEIVRYVTNGKTVFGHKFGFTKHREYCDADVMWVSWSSYSKDIKQFQGSSPILEFQTSQITLRFNLTYIATATLTPDLYVLAFTNFLANEKLISLFESEKEVIVRVAYPDDFVKKFDVPEDRFDVSGFKEARERATKACQHHETAS